MAFDPPAGGGGVRLCMHAWGLCNSVQRLAYARSRSRRAGNDLVQTRALNMQLHNSKAAAWCLLASLLLVWLNGTLVSAKEGSLLSGLPFFSKDACSEAKPTLFLLSGIGGSQMSGTFKGNNSFCSHDVNKTVVWYADKWFLKRNLSCWGHMMSMQYDAQTNRWHNSSGTEIWADEGQFGVSDGSKQKLYYALLLKHLKAKHGYELGKDLFVLPFDWRIGIQGLMQHGILASFADKIADGVRGNCGQKAIVISHSFGANIMAHMLHTAEFKGWREANVKGWVPVGGPFGGAGATAWLSQISGDFFKLFPIVSNLLPIDVAHKFPLTVVGRSVYNFAFGLPSWGFMLPRDSVWPTDHVVVSTPIRNYTIMDQKQLMLDMGNVGGANILDESWAMNDAALAAGPVPGVETYCLYSTSVPTSTTLIFNNSIPYRQVSHRPMAVDFSPGDGVVDLKSLRLCSRFAPADHMVEVDGPLVDHSTILAHPLGLEGLSNILHKLGVPSSPAAAFSLGGVINFSLNFTQRHR